jgi:peroxiredoxin
MRALTACLMFAAMLIAAANDGPPVGRLMPPFALADQTGQTRTLKALLGPKGAVIFFLDDSPGSKPALLEIEQHLDAFRQLGLGAVAVTHDAVAEDKSVHFPLISDPMSKTGVTKPGALVVDPKGVVTAKYFIDEPNQRYTAAAILVRQFGWTPPEPRVEVEGRQLSAELSASNATVTSGERVVLTVEVDLRPNMHVYAPGVEGYIPIDWKMQDQDTAAVLAPKYPKSEKLYLKAIDETVPAYREHFRLLRDVTIGSADKLRPAVDASGHFNVEGSLRYQACDDRVCYIPQELKLKWTFQYEPAAH